MPTEQHNTTKKMKHLAAYLLLGLGGNASPSASDIKAVLESVGIEADDERLEKLISELQGKDINEVWPVIPEIVAGLHHGCVSLLLTELSSIADRRGLVQAGVRSVWRRRRRRCCCWRRWWRCRRRGSQGGGEGRGYVVHIQDPRDTRSPT